MPQITCPNCGTTINLENRKEIDVTLIKNAAKKNPLTFTELLHVTKLPRKTLSLRLKELCMNGTIVKTDGLYSANGVSGFGSNYAKAPLSLSRARVLTLIALLIAFSTSGYVLAAILAPQPAQPPHQEPVVLGTFTMTLDVHNVENLDGWQVAVTYDQSKLKVSEVMAGDFIGIQTPWFVNATDISGNMLMLGGVLPGDSPGQSGSGTLAEIVFDYYDAQYQMPQIDYQGEYLSVWWNNGVRISFDASTLTLTVQ